jgi:penicillin amidase
MMGFAAPSICDQVHLVAPGLNVAGMSFPGVPGVMIGWNDKVAFTTTSGGADLVDVYVLELNPENDAEYRHKGAWVKFETIEVEVKVAGAEPRKEKVLRSVYGPLIGAVDRKNHRAHTAAMSFWKKEALTFEAVIDFNFAGSVAEFAASVPKVSTSHNWFAADREGHIGFWFAGSHPVRRKGHDPRLPQKGDGSMDWEGMLPSEKWPRSVDPANGFFSNWNNKPSRAWEPTAFGKVFWGKRITDVITSKEKLTVEEFGGIARETAYHDFLADYFLPFILEAADEKTAATLKAYDRMKRDGAAEPAIVERWVESMMRRVFADELGETAVSTKMLRQYLASPLLYVLEKGASGVALKHDWTGGLDLKEAAREALAEALKAKGWKEAEVDFGGTKVKSERGRGTFQMVVEMTKEGPRAATLSAPGQREEGEHGRDQLENFRAWKLERFAWARSEMK